MLGYGILGAIRLGRCVVRSFFRFSLVIVTLAVGALAWSTAAYSADIPPSERPGIEALTTTLAESPSSMPANFAVADTSASAESDRATLALDALVVSVAGVIFLVSLHVARNRDTVKRRARRAIRRVQRRRRRERVRR